MRCLLACLTLCLLGFGLQAEAQAPTAPDVRKRAGVWERVLKRADAQLGAPNLTLPALEQIRGSVLAILDEVGSALPPVKQRVAELESLVAALGPAPKQSQTTESEDIAAQRAKLNEDLKPQKGDLKRLEIIVQRANATLEHITQRRREVMTRLLLLTGPSVWDGLTWSKAWVDMDSAFDRMARSPAEWWAHATVERQKAAAVCSCWPQSSSSPLPAPCFCAAMCCGGSAAAKSPSGPAMAAALPPRGPRDWPLV